MIPLPVLERMEQTTKESTAEVIGVAREQLVELIGMAKDPLGQDTYRCPSLSAPGTRDENGWIVPDNLTGGRCEKWRGHSGEHFNGEADWKLLWTTATEANG